MLFSYYALLSAGILGVAFFKTWRELNLVGFTFTLGIGSAWGFEYYRPELFSSTEPFLILFFLMYLSVAILYASRQAPNLKGLVDGTLVFGLPVVAFSLQYRLVEPYQYGLAISALTAGLVYISLTALLWKYRPQYMGLLTEAFLALGVVFGSLAIPLALDGQWTGAIWALEGAALVWVGLRQNRIIARTFGQLLQLGAGAAFIIDYHGLGLGLPFLNADFLGFFIISLGGLFTGYQLWARRGQMHSWEKHFHWLFLFWGLIWWFSGGLGQLEMFVAWPYQTSAILVWFSLSALIMGRLYQRLPWDALLYPMFGLLPVLVVICLSQLDDGFHSHPLHDLGYLAWPLALLVQYYLLWKYEHPLHRIVRRLEHVVALWLAIYLVAREFSWILDKLVDGGEVWPFMAWGLIPALAAQVILTWGQKLAWPFRKHWADYSGLGALVLLAEIVIWLVIGSLTQSGLPRPLPYLPILNPLELSQLFALQVLAAAWLRYRRGLFQWPEFLIRSRPGLDPGGDRLHRGQRRAGSGHPFLRPPALYPQGPLLQHDFSGRPVHLLDNHSLERHGPGHGQGPETSLVLRSRSLGGGGHQTLPGGPLQHRDYCPHHFIYCGGHTDAANRVPFAHTSPVSAKS